MDLGLWMDAAASTLGEGVRANAPLSGIGFVVGVLVGLTGVGGGALLTPLLIVGLGVPAATAVGTDLLHAALSKTVGVWIHVRSGTVDKKAALAMALGSVPAAVLCLAILRLFPFGLSAERFIPQAVAVALLLSAALLAAPPGALGRAIARWRQSAPRPDRVLTPPPRWLLVVGGGAVGAAVSLTSIGAGALGAALLGAAYPKMPAARIAGTDLAHAVPLALVAGLGHLAFSGHADLTLLPAMLCGSVPGMALGSRLAPRLPDKLLRRLLAGLLLAAAEKLWVG